MPHRRDWATWRSLEGFGLGSKTIQGLKAMMLYEGERLMQLLRRDSSNECKTVTFNNGRITITVAAQTGGDKSDA